MRKEAGEKIEKSRPAVRNPKNSEVRTAGRPSSSPCYGYNSLRYNYNVGSLRSTVSFCDIEGNGLAFLQSLVAVSYDTGEMYEYVLSVLRVGDEAVALCCVEPLNCTLVHKMPPVNIENKLVVPEHAGARQAYLSENKKHMFL